MGAPRAQHVTSHLLCLPTSLQRWPQWLGYPFSPFTGIRGLGPPEGGQVPLSLSHTWVVVAKGVSGTTWGLVGSGERWAGTVLSMVLLSPLVAFITAAPF